MLLPSETLNQIEELLFWLSQMLKVEIAWGRDNNTRVTDCG